MSIIYDFHGYILYHLLCSMFMYCYHVLFSYTVFMYCVMYCSCTVFMYSFHILFSCFTFHITFSFILTFQIILHSYTFSYIMSDRIISCYRTCHHIAVLCFSYHIISFHMSYSNHLFYVSCLHKYQRSGYRKLIRARRRCTHYTKQWSYQGLEALLSLYETMIIL